MMEYVVFPGPGSTSSKVGACMISPASIILCSCNTRFNDPRIPAKLWMRRTKLSTYTQSKLCYSSPAVSAYAHVIADAVAREVSSCFLRAFKKPENVLPSLDRTQVRKKHVWARLSCSLLLSLSYADSASLSAQHNKTSKKLNSRIQRAIIIMMISVNFQIW